MSRVAPAPTQVCTLAQDIKSFRLAGKYQSVLGKRNVPSTGRSRVELVNEALGWPAEEAQRRIQMVTVVRNKGRNTIWHTRDGQEIAIKDMTDSHLQNAIRFLERRKNEATLEDIGGWDDAPPMSVGLELMAYRGNLTEWQDLMQAELKRRGLTC